MARIVAILVTLLILALASLAQAQGECSGANTAFVGADGEGRCAVGWRNGTITYVSNLNNSGAGSLRECLEASGPRVCVPRVAGTIELQSRINITNGNVYLAGHLAPGGLQVRTGGSWSNCGENALITLAADAGSDVPSVLIRGLRLRPGVADIGSNGAGCTDMDGMAIFRADPFMIANVSVGWSSDGNIDITDQGGSSQGTVQDTVWSEPLTCDGISGSNCFATNGFVNPAGRGPVLLYRNLFYGAFNRAMTANFGGQSHYVNNVLIGGGTNKHALAYASNRLQQHQINYYGNWHKPDTYTNAENELGELYSTRDDGGGSSANSSVYVDPVALSYYCNSPANGCTSTPLCGTGCNTAVFTSNPMNIPLRTTSPHAFQTPVVVEDGLVACNRVMDAGSIVGASFYTTEDGSHAMDRDDADQRIFDRAGGCNYSTLASAPLDGSPWILDQPLNAPDRVANPGNYDAQGYPLMTSVTPYPDADADGMSDTWENAVCGGTVACLPWGDDELTGYPGTGGDGWTNFEEFGNGLRPVTNLILVNNTMTSNEIEDIINQAPAGSTIRFSPGTYQVNIRMTTQNATENARITIEAEPGSYPAWPHPQPPTGLFGVKLTPQPGDGTPVLQHMNQGATGGAYITVRGFEIDGSVGNGEDECHTERLLDTRNGQVGLIWEDMYLHHSSGSSCARMGKWHGGAIIRRMTITHCIKWDWEGEASAAGTPVPRTQNDSHGIDVGSSWAIIDPIGVDPRPTVVEDVYIQYTTGDSIQADPDRNSRRFDLTIRNATLNSGKLTTAACGAPPALPQDCRPSVPNGLLNCSDQNIGEDAVDTKTPDVGLWPLKSKVTMENVEMNNWQLECADNFGLCKALNIKENIIFSATDVTIKDTDIAFRLEGKTSRGAVDATVTRARVERVNTWLRLEDNIGLGVQDGSNPPIAAGDYGKVVEIIDTYVCESMPRDNPTTDLVANIEFNGDRDGYPPSQYSLIGNTFAELTCSGSPQPPPPPANLLHMIFSGGTYR